MPETEEVEELVWIRIEKFNEVDFNVEREVSVHSMLSGESIQKPTLIRQSGPYVADQDIVVCDGSLI